MWNATIKKKRLDTSEDSLAVNLANCFVENQLFLPTCITVWSAMLLIVIIATGTSDKEEEQVYCI